MNIESEIEASLSIELNVECPHCEDYFDLLSIDGLNDEGQIIKQACPDGNWSVEHRKFSEDINCPECGKIVKVRGIAW